LEACWDLTLEHAVDFETDNAKGLRAVGRDIRGGADKDSFGTREKLLCRGFNASAGARKVGAARHKGEGDGARDGGTTTHGLLRASNDIEFSGERKRVRCNEGLGGTPLPVTFGSDDSAESTLLCRSEEWRKCDTDQEPFGIKEAADGLPPWLFLVFDEHSVALCLKSRCRLHDVFNVELEPSLRNRNFIGPRRSAKAGLRCLRQRPEGKVNRPGFSGDLVS
jgi:hypothetical protein